MNKLIHAVKSNKLIAIAVLLIAGGLYTGGIVHANSPGNRGLYCGFTDLGRQGCHGLLKNNDLYNNNAGDSTTAPGNVLLYNTSDPKDDALPLATINSEASFVALYKSDLAGGSPTHYDYNSFGAAVTIDVMLGASGPDICAWYTPGAKTCTWQAAVAYAQDPAHLADWTSRINYYSVHNLITWDQTMYLAAGIPHGGHACVTDGPGCWTPTPKSPPMTPAYDDQDVVMVREDGDDAGIISIISFQNPDGSTFILNRICGNFEGVVEPIIAPPSAAASCAGMTLDTATPDPNRPFTLRAAVQYNPGSAASSAFGPDSISLQLTGPSPYKGYSQSTSSPVISGGVATASFTIPATGVSGTFNAVWQVTGPQAPTVPSCPASLTVAYQPYFDVAGGDVSAGQGFGSGCTDNTAADIKGYNLDSGGSSPNYFGASSRQMAIATGSITGFASDETNNITNNLGGSTDGIAAHLPSGLTGPNAVSAPSDYGSHFLGSYTGAWCVPDYVSGVTGAADYTSQPDWNDLTPNSTGYIVRLTGDQTLSSIRLRPGVRVTVVVTGGSVYVDGNITYGSYTDSQDVPQFNLLVSNGDIFIDPNVSELHGFYDAQSGDSTSGKIFTCANGNGLTHVLKNYAACGVQPLTIYGAVAANQVILGRTTGNIAKSGAVSDIPAERIVYTPELWFGGLSAPPTSCAQDPTQAQCMYQSYTPLPPVL